MLGWGGSCKVSWPGIWCGISNRDFRNGSHVKSEQDLIWDAWKADRSKENKAWFIVGSSWRRIWGGAAIWYLAKKALPAAHAVELYLSQNAALETHWRILYWSHYYKHRPWHIHRSTTEHLRAWPGSCSSFLKKFSAQNQVSFAVQD